MDLEAIRANIDRVDEELVALLEQRMDLVSQVATFKKESGKTVLDNQREALVLEKVANHVKNADYQETIRATFADIMAQSRQYQKQKLNRHEEN
ncbi:chorismate mutase [Streptococcus gallinaceus]|uniref:Chorismate mutase n=1 Tax=Streptococcus gallinaceus TaxID=165758 RepID=A0ABV2JJ98_9STRE|nr:chorismate mutase [Streptococcus gallinaceus]MCP1639053.1 chorismate mutase [Streptococcus gallinaceus]MCP1769703.1 chorismate mutase [Streptococcus gallinaceus]